MLLSHHFFSLYRGDIPVEYVATRSVVVLCVAKPTVDRRDRPSADQNQTTQALVECSEAVDRTSAADRRRVRSERGRIHCTRASDPGACTTDTNNYTSRLVFFVAIFA